MNSQRALAAILLLACLGGCVQLPDRTEPLRIVAPRIVLTADPAWPAVDWALLVQRPIADQTRGSVRIAVSSPHARLSFYPGLAWLDEMPEMLQTLMIQGFVDSGLTGGAARPGAARGRYSLATEARRFEAADHSDGKLAVELEVHASLMEIRGARAVASRVFRVRVPVTASGADALADAFEQALQRFIRDLVGWTLDAASTDTAGAVTTPRPDGGS
jgi:cholesterol transport system auxiliary component